MAGKVVMTYLGNTRCEVLDEPTHKRIAVGPMSEPGYSPMNLVASGLGT